MVAYAKAVALHKVLLTEQISIMPFFREYHTLLIIINYYKESFGYNPKQKV
jgi:hypothetical protein